MTRKRSPETPADLEAALLSRPEERIPLLVAALQGPGKAAIEDALRNDPALRGHLRAAIGDVQGLARAPWLVQFAVRVELREALPELLGVARANVGSRSEQAAQALLALADPACLQALGSDVELYAGLLQRLCVRALFALGTDVAWDRLAKDVAVGGATANSTLWHLASEPTLAAEDPRWVDVATAALGTTAAEAARAVLLAALTPEQRAARFAGRTPAVVPSPSSAEALEAARASVGALLSKLPGLPAADADAVARLEELESLLGRVPASVRALHERVDGIDVPGDKPRSRAKLYGTRVILEQAREWAHRYDPGRAPRELVPPFLWPVAPDGFTRAGLSGGPPYGFDPGSMEDDPVLANAPRKPRFSAFARSVLRTASRLRSPAPSTRTRKR